MKSEMDYSWHRRSMDAIHHGALTNSKRPECFVKGVYPTHVIKGEGCYLWDTKGKRYIDYICGLGSNLIGYANPSINEAIQMQLFKGTLYSLSSTLEVQAAEKIKEIIPFAGKIRFLKTGTDACNAAIRIALAHTGRKKILSHGYHGWGDAFISLSPPALGVPEQPHVASLTSLDQITEDVACVIVEPIITDFSSERVLYLNLLREKCKKTGTLLIFDEIITGFRWPNYTVSNDIGIQPDIILLGKAAGGGLPLSIVATKPGIGENLEWFVSSTFAGETLSLAACLRTLDLLKNNFRLPVLWESGRDFMNRFNAICPDIVKLEGYPTRGVFVATTENKALFFQEACKSGILFGSSFFYNFCHPNFNDIVISSCTDIINRIKHKLVTLEGEPPKSPFSQKMREKQ